MTSIRGVPARVPIAELNSIAKNVKEQKEIDKETEAQGEILEIMGVDVKTNSMGLPDVSELDRRSKEMM
jgi:hypothetical protein